jgi:hypothetical protein
MKSSLRLYKVAYKANVDYIKYVVLLGTRTVTNREVGFFTVHYLCLTSPTLTTNCNDMVG